MSKAVSKYSITNWSCFFNGRLHFLVLIAEKASCCQVSSPCLVLFKSAILLDVDAPFNWLVRSGFSAAVGMLCSSMNLSQSFSGGRHVGRQY